MLCVLGRVDPNSGMADEAYTAIAATAAASTANDPDQNGTLCAIKFISRTGGSHSGSIQVHYVQCMCLHLPRGADTPAFPALPAARTLWTLVLTAAVTSAGATPLIGCRGD